MASMVTNAPCRSSNASSLGMAVISLDPSATACCPSVRWCSTAQALIRCKAALHLISAWAVEHHLTLGQQAVAEGSNEITAIPKLLALLDLHGALVTVDAMGCQKEIAEQIIEQGGDYVLAVKENQPTLHTQIEQLDDAAWAKDYPGVSCYCTQEQSHGRQEVRACWVLTDL